MSRAAAVLVVAAVCLSLPPVALADPPPEDDSKPAAASYVPQVVAPVLEEMEKAREARQTEARKETDAIRERQEAERKQTKESTRVLLARMPDFETPAAPKSFEQAFHTPPQAQFNTGTCWAYAGTSFLESEVHRITRKKVKLSEMFTVYWEYVEKARRFVRERGGSLVSEGSESNAVLRMWKLHGAVPLSDYKGTLAKDGRHDHELMSAEIRGFLAHVKAEERWDEAWVVTVVRSILDRYMGPPPTTVMSGTKKVTPMSFVSDVLGITPDDYIDFMSTLKEPMWTKAVFDVPDNWWRDGSYHNVPLDIFVQALRQAVEGGYTVSIGGDVSEPGKLRANDLFYVPSFDIPAAHIDRFAREHRIANGTTTDDHGVHLVGYKDLASGRWYLIKDSGRSARHGKHNGYYFMHEDYVKLKMLSLAVHKDAVRNILVRMLRRPPKAGKPGRVR